MTLFHQALEGIDKQIADLLKSRKGIDNSIRDLRKERKEIMEKYGIEEEVHPLIKVIKKYKRVSKLKIPTNTECETLIQLYGESAVLEKLKDMEDWRDITKNVTVYRTMVKWFNRDRTKADQRAYGFKEDWKETIDKAKKQIARQGTIQPGDLTRGL